MDRVGFEPTTQLSVQISNLLLWAAQPSIQYYILS